MVGSAAACDDNEQSVITLNNKSESRAGIVVNWPRSTTAIFIEPGESLSLPPTDVGEIMLFFDNGDNAFSPAEDPTFNIDLGEALRGDTQVDITGPPLGLEGG